MRRSRILSLLAVPALLGSALASCGGEGTALPEVDVARAADATAKKGTARMALSMRMSGLGLPDEIELSARGVTSLDTPRADFTMDFENLFTVGGQSWGDTTMKVRLDGAALFVDPPRIPGLTIPGGDGWIALDLRRVSDAVGIDPDAAGALFTIDPASQLRALREAGSLEEIGTEEVGGAETTHLKGAYSMDDVVAALPAERRDEVREALEQVEELAPGSVRTGDDLPVELWVDGDSVVRRMRTSSPLPAQGGTPAGTFDMTYQLSDFGAALDVTRPAGATDLTDRLVALLGRFAPGKSRGGTSSG